MTLSVVVGTLNRLALLRQCLDSIAGETRTPVRIYVTDAGSTDGTIEFLRSVASERLVPIFVGRRLGQARAYNDVFAQVATPYVCWLSDDNVVVDGGLDRAVAILEDDAAIGMVGLKVRDVIGPFAPSPYIGGISDIGVLNVNQGVLRTPILASVGGFSETFRDYGIDPDLTARILFAGHDIVYTKAVAVHHFRAWSADETSDEYRRRMEQQRRSRELYRQKYGALRAGGLGWKAKRLAWTFLRVVAGLDLDAGGAVLGQLPRDWHNTCSSRYIALLDGWTCRRRAYHLRQSCPPRERSRISPRELADDRWLTDAVDEPTPSRAGRRASLVRRKRTG